MITVNYRKWMISALIFLLPIVSLAAVPTWQILPNESRLTFTATQNNAPVTGEFKTFTGNINFDPEKLEENNVEIIVDISSVSDAYNQLADTLKNTDWFDTAQFPKAVFKANKFSKTDDKTYHANGTLTLRDKTIPITLTFTLDKISPTNILCKGSTILSRTAFGVGQGEWADTKAIKDEVRVDFVVSAQKK